MPQDKWSENVNKIFQGFLENDLEIEYPDIAASIDEGLDDLLHDVATEPNTIYPLDAEELLRDCIARIGNCLSIREKAQDIEARAISDALNFKMQSATLEAESAIREVLKPIRHKISINASKAITTQTKATDISTELTYIGDQESWERVTSAEESLSSTRNFLLGTTKTKANTPGNGSNYVERFGFLKEIFNKNATEAYKRALICASALKAIYDIKSPVPKVTKTGYLNSLAIWAQSTSDLLDIEIDSRVESDTILNLCGADAPGLGANEIIPKQKFLDSLKAGNIIFTITKEQLEKLGFYAPLVRGLEIAITSKDASPAKVWPYTLTLPDSPALNFSPAHRSIANSNLQSSIENIKRTRSTHNINPIGTWRLNFLEKGSPSSSIDDNIQAAYLILTISHKRGA